MKKNYGWITVVLLAMMLGAGVWSVRQWSHESGYDASLSAEVSQAGRWVRGVLVVELSSPDWRWRGVLNGRCGMTGGGCALSFGDNDGID